MRLTTANSAIGILPNDGCFVANNSVFATDGTGFGIGNTSSGRDWMTIINNIVEGFSVAPGAGYRMFNTNNVFLMGHNAAFNNYDNTSMDVSHFFFNQGGDAIPLTKSAFVDPANNDFSTGTEVKATGFPTFIGGGITALTEQFMDMGAAQREESAGGGSGFNHSGSLG